VTRSVTKGRASPPPLEKLSPPL